MDVIASFIHLFIHSILMLPPLPNGSIFDVVVLFGALPLPFNVRWMCWVSSQALFSDSALLTPFSSPFPPLYHLRSFPKELEFASALHLQSLHICLNDFNYRAPIPLLTPLVTCIPYKPQQYIQLKI